MGAKYILFKNMVLNESTNLESVELIGAAREHAQLKIRLDFSTFPLKVVGFDIAPNEFDDIRSGCFFDLDYGLQDVVDGHHLEEVGGAGIRTRKLAPPLFCPLFLCLSDHLHFGSWNVNALSRILDAVKIITQ